MANVVRAEAVITAQDKLRPGLSSAARQLEAFRRNQSKAAPVFAGQQMLDRQAALVRRAATLAAGYMSAQGAKQTVVRAADVDRQMRRAAITGDAVEGRIASATADVRTIALDTAQPIDKVREGLDQLVASGMDFETSMKALPGVAKTAQASGAAVSDIATTSTAMVDNFAIEAGKIEAAYDILAKGGKLGKFELKDMARYLPSMLPAAKAVGLAGEDGLAKMVAMLQVIRAGTGTAEEAAASANNIFAKMESEETAKKFKKMGVDLRKEMTNARKDGKDLLSTFVDLSEKALKGDHSKLPQLFTDMEFARGMRALLAGRGKIAGLTDEIRNSAGTIDADFNRVVKDTQASVDRLSESFDRAKSGVGMFIAALGADQIKDASGALQGFARHLEQVQQTMAEKGKWAGARALVQPIVDEVTGAAADREDFTRRTGRQQKAAQATKRISALDGEIAAYEAEPNDAVAKNPAAMDMRRRRLAALRAERDTLRGEYSDLLGAAILDENPVPDAGAAEDGALRTMREDALEQMRERMRAEALRFKDKSKGGKPDIPLPPPRPVDLNGAMPDAPVADFGEDRPAVTPADDAGERARQAAHAAPRAVDTARQDYRAAVKPAPPPAAEPQLPLPPVDAARQDYRAAVKPPGPQAPDATAMAATAERVAAAWQMTGSKIAAAMEPAGAAIDRVRESAGQAVPSLALPPPDLAPWMGAGVEIASGLKPAEKGVEQIKASVDGLGPAGQSAGSHLSQGLVSGILAAEAQVSASVERMQAKLNSLKAPSLGGGGGFNTGRAMPEIR